MKIIVSSEILKEKIVLKRGWLLRSWLVLIVGFLLTFTALCPDGSHFKTAEASDMSDLLRLLEAKGVIDKKEAAEFRRSYGASSSTADGMNGLVSLLKSKGVLDDDEAAGLLAASPDAAFEQRSAKAPLIPPEKEDEVVRRISKDVAAEVKKNVKAEIKDEVRKDALANLWPEGTPDWVKRVRWGGDIRIRYQGEYFSNSNVVGLGKPPDGTEVLNTTKDRQRALLRARLSAGVKVNDEVEAKVRITTGNEKNPVTTNNALEMSGKSDLVLDQAYLQYKPSEEFSLAAGRMPNPWFYTDLVWDHDLSFDGLAASGKAPLWGSATGFLTAGIFPLEEVELSTDDKWLWGVQAGVEGQPAMALTAKAAVAYYDYNNVIGQRNDANQLGEKDFSVPAFQQKGNTLMDIDPTDDTLAALASEYKELNVTGSLDFSGWHPVHVVLTADYVKNLGFDKSDVQKRTLLPSVKEETDGYQVGLAVGHKEIAKRWDWKTFLAYKHLEADAVLDAFTDSDFHGGGTNAQGWILGGELGLMKNVWLTARWMTADEISGDPLAIDVLQVDLNARY